MTVSVEERPAQEAPAPVQPKPEPVEAKPEPVVDEYATWDDLIGKKPREEDISLTINGTRKKVRLRAIGSTAYDQLVAACPPTRDQQDKGAIYDINAFAPKLIAACMTRPKLDLDRVTRLWADPNWSGGEAGGLYQACVTICQAGLDVPFNVSG